MVVADSIPFTSYLEAKKRIDDRSLNKRVLETLRISLPRRRMRVVEVGAGIGTMISRLIEWDVLKEAEYTACDANEECIEGAIDHLDRWALYERYRLIHLGQRACSIKGHGRRSRWISNMGTSR